MATIGVAFFSASASVGALFILEGKSMDGKEEATVQPERNKNPLLIPFVIALIGSLLLLVWSLFRLLHSLSS